MAMCWLLWFFAAGCFLASWLPKGKPTCGYRVVATDETIGCEYPESESEAIRWDDVSRVVLATTSDGPWLPDRWLFFFAVNGREFPIPTEAEGFDQLFDVLNAKFPGFDFEPFIAAGVDDALYICWERSGCVNV